MCLVGGIRTATKIKRNVGVSLTTEPSMLLPSNAQNTYLIYSVCRLLLKINCSNVLNTRFINKSVVNLATRALVTYTALRYKPASHAEGRGFDPHSGQKVIRFFFLLIH